jgi:hypothetical protein
MMCHRPFTTALLVVLIATFSVAPLSAQSPPRWFLDIETGLVVPGYCDVRIPGDGGTLFSLTGDLSTGSEAFLRIRAGFRPHPRHTIVALFAPLTLSGSGRLDKPVDYNGLNFPAGTPLESVYRFNSYRLSWRYGLKEGERWRIGLGLTAKIRDAFIQLSGGGQTTKNANVGFVPLINFFLEWRLSPGFRLLLEGDAAAAPQGRAEDVQLALVYQSNKKWEWRAGYRILEGGADNDRVYNFALFHYFLVGVKYHL